jgi:transcriptional regulator with XRE-family HTH domain
MADDIDLNPAIISAVADAAAVLGQQIHAARLDHDFTAKDLAERANVSQETVLAVEAGSTTTRIGVVFTLAMVVGVRLFQLQDYDAYTRERIRSAQEIALLTARVTHPREEISTDF